VIIEARSARNWLTSATLALVCATAGLGQAAAPSEAPFPTLTGNELTAATGFTGTRWRFAEGPSSSNEIHFDKAGALAYKFHPTNPVYFGGATGNWHVRDGVLYFEVRGYSFHAVRLEDKFLRGTRHTPSAAQGQRDAAITLYRVEDVETAKAMDARHERNYEAFRALIEKKRTQVLEESPERERLLTRDFEKSGRNDYLTLCDPQQLPTALYYGMSKDMLAGDLCYAWTGTRAEWKKTILTEGCRGRCRGF
jgi:hypothetical protein